ncbi:MAG: fimbrillin family protein [Paludibacteraceae bacterium]|nr:fimbrillin family protein [Paludibacteraceae bacterium]
MTKRNYIVGILLLAAGLLAGCSHVNEPDPNRQNEIAVTTGVEQMGRGMAPRYAKTYDNLDSLKNERSFTCVAYEADSDPLTAYIETTTVDWNSGESVWEFNSGADHYYWPLPTSNGGEYPSLDFFAYMPATPPSYIENLIYEANHNVSFDCVNLPMGDTLQNSEKEFIYGMALGQNKTNASSGVPLVFKHPFARVKLQLAASHPNIIINNITFKGLKNNGSFVYDHSETTFTWTPTGVATNLAFTDTTEYKNVPASAQAIGKAFIVIPQEWAGEIEVNASWNDWGDTPVPHQLSTTITAVTWRVGYSYTYTFNITPEDLTVNLTNFTEQW